MDLKDIELTVNAFQKEFVKWPKPN